MEDEIWKPIKGYEGYLISNYGRVKSVARYVKWDNSRRFVKEKIKSQHIQDGYPAVTLCKDRVSRSKLIHRLIAEAFIPNPDNKPHIDHINTIRTDNRVSNLRWVTAKENSNNPISLLKARNNNYTNKDVRKRANETKRLKKSVNAPIRVYQFDKDGKFINEFDSYAEAYRQTGISAVTIRRVCNGLHYMAGGYYWSVDKDNFKIPTRKRHTNAKKVLQFTKTGEFIKEWDCLADVCKVYGSAPSNLTKRIKLGKFRGKYIWKFKE